MQPLNPSRETTTASSRGRRARAGVVFKQAIKMNYYQTHAETQPLFSPGIGESRMKM